jgi:hypothetical protein
MENPMDNPMISHRFFSFGLDQISLFLRIDVYYPQSSPQMGDISSINQIKSNQINHHFVTVKCGKISFFVTNTIDEPLINGLV